MKLSQELEDHLLHTRREKDRLEMQLDRTQKELQQATDCYAAYQMVRVGYMPNTHVLIGGDLVQI